MNRRRDAPVVHLLERFVPRGAALAGGLAQDEVAARGQRVPQRRDQPPRVIGAGDEVIERFEGELEKLEPGDPMAAETSLAPLSSRAALEGVLKQIDTAVKGGAKVLLGGKKLQRRGFFTIRDAVDIAAEALKISRYSVYNYLNEIEASRQAAPSS